MSSHNLDTGNRGEDIATEFLQRKGYTILERNWRHSRSEVDIIAEDKGMIVFVEVKTRRSQKFGHPEESVSEAKQQKLLEAADAYLESLEDAKELRFDIVSIRIGHNQQPTIYHIVDAFYPYQD